MKKHFLNRKTVSTFLRVRTRERSVGMHMLKEYTSKEKVDEAIVCAVCDYVTTCDHIVKALQELLDKDPGQKISLDSYQVGALKLFTTALAAIKHQSVFDHNISLEIH